MSNDAPHAIRRSRVARGSASVAIMALGISVTLRPVSLALATDDDAAPTAEAIIEQFIEVTGGREAHKKIRNRVTKGHLEFVHTGVSAPVETYAAPPNKQYSRVETPTAGIVEEGTDGEVAWRRSELHGPQVRQGKENEAALRDATFDRPLHWRDIFETARLAGSETVGGKPAHKIVLKLANGESETWYFDKETHFLVRQDSIVTLPTNQQLPLSVTRQDYREVDGIMIPFSSTQTFNDEEIRLITGTVEHNVDLPANRFDLPDDVKALVEQAGAAKADAQEQVKDSPPEATPAREDED